MMATTGQRASGSSCAAAVAERVVNTLERNDQSMRYCSEHAGRRFLLLIRRRSVQTTVVDCHRCRRRSHGPKFSSPTHTIRLNSFLRSNKKDLHEFSVIRHVILKYLAIINNSFNHSVLYG